MSSSLRCATFDGCHRCNFSNRFLFIASFPLSIPQAGIPIFVTGGIGGVHRGAEATMDVSADLSELGRTPVAVVCAGIKSILDIPKTLEVLETQARLGSGI
jgi:pseudouridine-5'-phosphate glycosidase